MKRPNPPTNIGQMPPAGARGPRAPGYFVGVNRLGRLHFRTWPRQSTRQENAKKLTSAELFMERVKAIKLEFGDAQISALRMSTGTVLLPRDVQMMLMANSAFCGFWINGRLYVPIQTMNDVSQSLDAIGQVDGDLLLRTTEGWRAIVLGEVGQVLTCTGEAVPVGWRDSGGAGGLSYQVVPTFGSATTTAFATKGIVFTPTLDIPISAIAAYSNNGQGQTWQARLVKLSLGTITEIIATSDELTVPNGYRPVIRLPFDATYIAATGTDYAVLISRTDSGPTNYPLITQLQTGLAGLHAEPASINYARIASTSPAVDDALDIGDASSPPFAVWPEA